MSDQVAVIRSRDEIESAISAFTTADWARLSKVARRYAFGRPIEPEDLIQEALLRALNSRHCPANVDVVKFLAEAIRSIADGEAEKVEHRLTAISVAGDYQDQALHHPDPSPSVEEDIISQQDAAQIRGSILALFDDDPDARDLVEGIMEGMTAEELRELTGLEKTAYDSKRKFIRRRIDKAYPKGWKP